MHALLRRLKTLLAWLRPNGCTSSFVMPRQRSTRRRGNFISRRLGRLSYATFRIRNLCAHGSLSHNRDKETGWGAPQSHDFGSRTRLPSPGRSPQGGGSALI